MSKLLITYGMDPISGIRVLLDSPPKGTWWGTLRHLGHMIQRQRVHISLGTMIPTEQKALLPLVARLKFFIALEADSASPKKQVPLLGSPTGIQVYEQHQGQETYKTEVVRFSLGKASRHRS